MDRRRTAVPVLARLATRKAFAGLGSLKDLVRKAKNALTLMTKGVVAVAAKADPNRQGGELVATPARLPAKKGKARANEARRQPKGQRKCVPFT